MDEVLNYLLDDKIIQEVLHDVNEMVQEEDMSGELFQ